jgi:hypothetical protein
MPEVLKCPKCDANADVTKDGKNKHPSSPKPSSNPSPKHLMSSTNNLQVNGHIVLHVSFHTTKPSTKGLGRREDQRAEIPSQATTSSSLKRAPI